MQLRLVLDLDFGTKHPSNDLHYSGLCLRMEYLDLYHICNNYGLLSDESHVYNLLRSRNRTSNDSVHKLIRESFDKLKEELGHQDYIIIKNRIKL